MHEIYHYPCFTDEKSEFRGLELLVEGPQAIMRK